MKGGGVFPMDTLSNVNFGRNSDGYNYRCYIRFRAGKSGTPSSIKLWMADGAGYSGGNGGLPRCNIWPDDGSGNRNMSGSPIAQADFSLNMSSGVFANPDDRFNAHTFGTVNGNIVAGTLYHLEFLSRAEDTTFGYSNVDCYGQHMTNSSDGTPYLLDSDWTVWQAWRQQGSTGAWTFDHMNVASPYRIMPNFQLNFTNGTSFGLMNFDAAQHLTATLATSSAPIRDVITPPTSWTLIGCRVSCAFDVAGTVNVAVKNSGGTTLATGSFSEGSANSGVLADGTIPKRFYYSVTFSSPVTISSETFVEFTPAGSAQVRFFDKRDGRQSPYNFVNLMADTQHFKAQWFVSGGWRHRVYTNPSSDANITCWQHAYTIA
jgi:hypothetical protein